MKKRIYLKIFTAVILITVIYSNFQIIDFDESFNNMALNHITIPNYYTSLDYLATLDYIENHSTLLVKEDFENSIIKDFTFEKVKEDSIEISKDLLNNSNNVLKITVEYGDITHNGNRAECVYNINQKVGEEYYYLLKFMLDKNFKNSKEWQCFMQFHDQPEFDKGYDWLNFPQRTPPLFLTYINDKLRLVGNSYKSNKMKINKGQWYQAIIHMKNGYKKNGFIEVIIDGKSLTNGKVFTSTINNDQCNYFKFGIYRSRSIESTNTIYFDDIYIYRVNT